MRKGTVAVFSTIAGVIAGALVGGSVTGKSVEQKSKKVDKFRGYYNLLNQWLFLKQSGKSLEEYFEKNNYKKIAIYGMGEMGNRLYEELKNSNINIKYAIDKEAECVYSELKVVDLEEELEEVDVIVVAATFAFEEIEEKLRDQVDCMIVSLEDVVFEL